VFNSHELAVVVPLSEETGHTVVTDDEILFFGLGELFSIFFDGGQAIALDDLPEAKQQGKWRT
jgi:hypothetical protein